MIQAALFDLGDTLVSFQQADLYAAYEEAARQTYDYLRRTLAGPMPKFSSYRRQHFWRLRWAYFVSRITGGEFNSTDILRRCCARLGIAVPERLFPELAWQWYRPLAERTQPEPDARETLEALRARGLALALVSNTFVAGEVIDRHLDQAGLLDYFPVRVYSCDFGLRKPRREIFEHALRLVGTAARQAIFVGDTYDTDIVGARRAGLVAVYKSFDPPEGPLDDRTFHIRNLAEIPGLIDRLAGQAGTSGRPGGEPR